MAATRLQFFTDAIADKLERSRRTEIEKPWMKHYGALWNRFVGLEAVERWVTEELASVNPEDWKRSSIRTQLRFLEGDGRLRELVWAAERLCIPAIVIGEFSFGRRAFRRRRSIEEVLDALLSDVRVLGVREETTKHYAKV